jgi:hypothetical protein
MLRPVPMVRLAHHARNLQFNRFAPFKASRQFKVQRFKKVKVILRPVPTVSAVSNVLLLR